MSKSLDSISKTTMRRFILGRQGLWPGRRWAGYEDTAVALQTVEAVQIDPVAVVAQSHDIVLWGRVLDYQPDYLQNWCNGERRFFDFGGSLFIYPMTELPYWRHVMARYKKQPRWKQFAAANPVLLDEVREAIRTQGPLRKRDLAGKRVNAYRGTKDTGVALHYLWLIGELMTYKRIGKERMYAFTENIAPPDYQHTAPTADVIPFFLRKVVAQNGLIDARKLRAVWNGLVDTRVPLPDVAARLQAMAEDGVVTAVTIPDYKEPLYYLTTDKPLLEEIDAGRVPTAWQPLQTTTQEEVVFLSPLEYVSARRRALKLFDFDYIWEIYKPAAERKYGPYVLPVLYGDQLVARMDVKLERPLRTLHVNGFWLEDWFKPDAAFNAALTKGLRRFMTFLGAVKMIGDAIAPYGKVDFEQ